MLRDNPDHPEALNLLGTLASTAKNHAIAIECLIKAVTAQPKNMIYRNNLGYCLNGARKPREAIPHFRKVIDGTAHAGAIGGPGRRPSQLGEGEEAEKVLRRALGFAPESKRAQNGACRSA